LEACFINESAQRSNGRNDLIKVELQVMLLIRWANQVPVIQAEISRQPFKTSVQVINRAKLEHLAAFLTPEKIRESCPMNATNRARLGEEGYLLAKGCFFGFQYKPSFALERIDQQLLINRTATGISAGYIYFFNRRRAGLNGFEEMATQKMDRMRIVTTGHRRR